MTPEHTDDAESQRRIDRRTVLEKGALAVGGLALGVGEAGANQGAEIFTRDFTGLERPHPCRDENLVATEALQKVRTHTTVDGGGGVHFDATLWWDGGITGVGEESGIEWSGQGTKSISKTLRGPFPQTFTRIDNTVATADGDTDNIRFRLEVHFTVDADGDVTAVRRELVFECFG
ncbi:MAG: hypothetical protein ABEH66_07295 [Halobacteriales archaeon]